MGRAPSQAGQSPLSTQFWCWFNLSHAVLLLFTAATLVIVSVNKTRPLCLKPTTGSLPPVPKQPLLLSSAGSLHTLSPAHTSPAPLASSRSWNIGCFCLTGCSLASPPAGPPCPPIAGPFVLLWPPHLKWLPSHRHTTLCHFLHHGHPSRMD